MVKNYSKKLSSIENRPKHAALTHFLRHNWWRSPFVLQAILSKCNVAPYLGALPPELRARVPKEKLSEITHEFRVQLEDFLIDKIAEIRESMDVLLYRPEKIEAVFNTKCIMEFGATNYAGYRTWGGGFGIVCKMSFPELKAEYALKIFTPSASPFVRDHGPIFEISTAFAAMHAEAKDNAQVYMASFIYEPYMLSRWEGDVADGYIRKNKNEIFVTSDYEMDRRNYRNGRRIDFGETFRTAYGAADYRVRKMCRKIINVAEKSDFDAIQKIKQEAFATKPNGRKEYQQALDLVYYIANHNVEEMMKQAKSY